MENIIGFVLFLVLLIIIRFILRNWKVQYEKTNPIEIKASEIRSYDQFIHSYTKMFYSATKFLIIIVIMMIVYQLIELIAG
jgi:hypothetical protein